MRSATTGDHAATSAISSSLDGSLGASRIIRFLNRKPAPPSRKIYPAKSDRDRLTWAVTECRERVPVAGGGVGIGAQKKSVTRFPGPDSGLLSAGHAETTAEDAGAGIDGEGRARKTRRHADDRCPRRFEQGALVSEEAFAFRSMRAARRASRCLCAFNRRKPFFASCIAAAAQRRPMEGERQYLTYRQTRRTVLMTFSTMFAQVSERPSSDGSFNLMTVSISSSP